jgi:hypothetical protein
MLQQKWLHLLALTRTRCRMNDRGNSALQGASSISISERSSFATLNRSSKYQNQLPVLGGVALRSAAKQKGLVERRDQKQGAIPRAWMDDHDLCRGV